MTAADHPARVKPKPHHTELTYLTEDGIDPIKLRDIVENIELLLAQGMPGERITELHLNDHVLRVVVS